MEPKVSIVVPVYGVEKYIAECIVSLQQQTYENLEIILVDDGGKDRSADICEEYAKHDPRLVVIHKPNGGAASARNVGIDAVTGEYVCFVDADDVVNKDYVRCLWNTISVTDADIAECGIQYWSKTAYEPIPIEDVGIFSRNEYLRGFLRSWHCALMTNKMFKRTVIGDVRFEEGHKIDDEFFTYLVVLNSKKIIVTDTPLYDYRLRQSSVMRDVGSHKDRVLQDRVEYTSARYRNVSQAVPDL